MNSFFWLARTITRRDAAVDRLCSRFGPRAGAHRAFCRLVDIAKMRWRIERDYQDLKQEIGLGHYEGRGWRGFHHHGTLCIAAYGFLISERETIPPSGPGFAGMFAKPAISAGYRPRGAAAPAPTAHPPAWC
jgi:hypothetical protein